MIKYSLLRKLLLVQFSNILQLIKMEVEFNKYKIHNFYKTIYLYVCILFSIKKYWKNSITFLKFRFTLL